MITHNSLRIFASSNRWTFICLRWSLSAEAVEMDLHFRQFNYRACQTGWRSSQDSFSAKFNNPRDRQITSEIFLIAQLLLSDSMRWRRTANGDFSFRALRDFNNFSNCDSDICNKKSRAIYMLYTNVNVSYRSLRKPSKLCIHSLEFYTQTSAYHHAVNFNPNSFSQSHRYRAHMATHKNIKATNTQPNWFDVTVVGTFVLFISFHFAPRSNFNRSLIMKRNVSVRRNSRALKQLCSQVYVTLSL